jgi:hypothetical protein
VSGFGTLTGILPHPSGNGHMCYGMFGLLFGIQNGFGEGAFTKRVVKPLHFGDRVTMTLRVRKDKLTGLVNGDVIFDRKPDPADLRGLFSWKLGDPKRVGIGTDNTVITFHRVDVKEISGPGTKK